jgi:hypothetical protein
MPAGRSSRIAIPLRDVPEFDGLYSKTGRPQVAPEELPIGRV